MRFAIKTAPQHTTWQAMLDVFKAVAEQASAFAEVGCDLVVVALAPHDPALLEPLADALSQL